MEHKMKRRNPICAILAGFLSVVLPVLSGYARPGEVLPKILPDFEKQGTVFAAAEAPDGSFFVMGDFTTVDGVSRPGLAKLDASGRLDESFAPEVGPNVVTVHTLAPQHPREQFGFYWSSPTRSERLLPLSTGGVIVMGELGWIIDSEHPVSFCRYFEEICGCWSDLCFDQGRG